jgi:two-component system chemotaxis response regulator CheB
VSHRIRVLVVDDSAFVRKAVGRMLATADDIEVVGFARDGEEGLALARELRPDVVTLDVRMPKLGGLETLERLMAEQPVPVLLMSTLTQEGAEVTLRGLELGAMEFVDKSAVEPMSMLSLAEELISKIRALGGARVRSRPRAQPKGEGAAGRPSAQCVTIAASTGGPSALQAVEPGRVLLAPAGIHTRLVRSRAGVEVSLEEEPSEALHRPSANVLMTSAAEVYGPLAVGVVLTGMGSDGTEGLRAIRERGGLTLAESEETCVIFGMPKAAIEAGVIERTLPLDRIAASILGAV